MADQKASPGSAPVPPLVKSESHREIYSNSSRVGMSPWDVSIVFGTIEDAPPGQLAGTRAEVTIRMSPHQFKAFAGSLPLILTEWEARFGEINLSQAFTMSAEMMREALKAAETPVLGAQSPVMPTGEKQVAKKHP